MLTKIVRLGLRFGSGSEARAIDLSSGKAQSGELEFVCDTHRGDDYGLVHRTDRVTNTGSQPLRIARPSFIYTVTGSDFTLATHTSSWCRESQHVALDLRNGPVDIGSKGRTCQGYSPYFVVGSPDFGDLVFNLMPCGDWRAVFTTSDDGKTLEIAVDRFDDSVVVDVAPSETYSFEMDCLIQQCPLGEAYFWGWRVQCYALEKLMIHRRAELPVIYNTWFDYFHKINVERLTEQLNAAAEVGCEAFVIDAGWYGAQPANWSTLNGDWRENPNVFGKTSLKEFADTVRARGLIFGIWMEPERVCTNAPIYSQHPEWFLPVAGADTFYPDLTNESAREWVYSEMCRVISTYGVGWIKIDTNLDFSDDPYHTGNQRRMDEWFAILDRVAERFPDLVMEGCASGGLRNDLLTISHFHTHFPSDTVDPVHELRIAMADYSRLSPLMFTKWAVMNPTGKYTRYDYEPGDTGDHVLCPFDATSYNLMTYHLDLVMAVNSTGALGLGGGLADMSDTMKRDIAAHIDFYKRHRKFILSSVAVPLTPVESMDNDKGHAVIQLSSTDFVSSMIFAYGLRTKDTAAGVYPKHLDAARSFTVTSKSGETIVESVAGDDLCKSGFELPCEAGHAAIAFIEALDGGFHR